MRSGRKPKVRGKTCIYLRLSNAQRAERRETDLDRSAPGDAGYVCLESLLSNLFPIG